MKDTENRSRSHLICLTSRSHCAISPAINATGGTIPHASSVEVCASRVDEKLVQFTVQFGKTKAGNAAENGTSH